MNQMQTFNLKKFNPAAQDAMAILDLELEHFLKCGVKVVKIVHGYGSHGKGGLILGSLKRYAAQNLKSKKLLDVIYGSDWNIANKKVFDLCLAVPDCASDEDLKFCNPGVTIVVLNTERKL